MIRTESIEYIWGSKYQKHSNIDNLVNFNDIYSTKCFNGKHRMLIIP